MNFRIDKQQFIKDGQPIKIISGAVHYFRNLPDTWDDILNKMVALGCNCVETYCAWNMHEKVPGKYDFSGLLNISEFLKKAQAHGLMAIVRPGPYICAEWEFGGLPWWLHSIPNMEIRCSNSVYMQYFSRYIARLFDEVRPMLCTNGGNVIMMQVENEYGYYGDDKKYLRELVDIYRKNGIDVPLFTSDGTYESALLDGRADECFSTLNFGSHVAENFIVHDRLFPDEPKMCMEMWNGWFDAWGDAKHHVTSVEDYSKTVDEMLACGSVNMFLFIGGTNFGFMSGANHTDKYLPDVTSYDYYALLTECGDVTDKYLAVRNVIKKYVDYELPPVPKNREKRAYGSLQAIESAELIENIDRLAVPIESEVPKCMEDYGFGYGYVLYKTQLNRDYTNAKILFEDIGDRAQVSVNKDYKGTVYVNDASYEVEFSAKKNDVLYVLCENMGRTNFGSKMMRKKGIIGRCLIDGKIHFGWKAYYLPMDNLKNLVFKTEINKNAETFYKFCFDCDTPSDTFLRTDNFRKGFAVLNGFNLGRYWELGPQKTLYVPSSVLKKGRNELIIFESDGLKGEPSVEFVNRPDLG